MKIIQNDWNRFWLNKFMLAFWFVSTRKKMMKMYGLPIYGIYWNHTFFLVTENVTNSFFSSIFKTFVTFHKDNNISLNEIFFNKTVVQLNSDIHFPSLNVNLKFKSIRIFDSFVKQRSLYILILKNILYMLEVSRRSQIKF